MSVLEERRLSFASDVVIFPARCHTFIRPRLCFSSCTIPRTRFASYVFHHSRNKSWIVSLFVAVDLARTAVGLFITLARQSVTRCQMNLEILAILTALNDSWEQFFSAVY